MNDFNFSFLCADRPVFKGKISSLVVPLDDGLYGIMAGHSNMIGAIVAGSLKFTANEKTEIYAVSEGLVKVEDGNVLVLADAAERPEEIDEARARRTMEKASLDMKKKQGQREYMQAQAELSRAMNRLKIKNRG